MFPAMRNHRAVPGGDVRDRVRGNPKRVESMVGAMGELLVRHARLDYGAHLRRCLDRLVS